MKTEIKRWDNGEIIYSCDADSIRGAVLLAVKEKNNLSSADLSSADLSGADLRSADLSGADLDDKHVFMSISPIGSENGCLWVMRNGEGVLIYNRGCFSGTEEQFIAAVKNKHAGTDYKPIYLAAVKFIKTALAGKLAKANKGGLV